MRLKMSARTINFDHWRYEDKNGNKMYIQNTVIKPDWKFIMGTEVEIIGDLIDVTPTVMWFRKVYRYRLMDNRKYIAGIFHLTL